MEVREPAVAYHKQKMTVEEYLAFENEAKEKHEYYQGEVFAMSGAKATHNEIVQNTNQAILNHLTDTPCKIYHSDQRIFVEKSSLFTYPDLSIICNGMKSLNNDEMNALNPSVIIDVLSPGTKDYDKVLKFKLYKEINELKEYILIDSEYINVDAYTISENGNWELREYKTIAETLLIQTIQLKIPVQAIYKDTKLT